MIERVQGIKDLAVRRQFDTLFAWLTEVLGADKSTTVAAAEFAGLSGSIPHASTTGRTPNDHHNQSHAHDGVDGSGTVAHSDTTGKTPNDHHNQSHAHDGVDGSGIVAHSSLNDDEPNQHIDWTNSTEDFDTSGEVQGGTAKFGDVAGGNYTEVESDGTVKFNGNATVWNDLPPVPILSAKLTGAGADPALTVFKVGTQQYTFAINDEVQGTQEILHEYKEGTTLVPHVHWVTNGLEAVATKVRWELTYTVANSDGSFTYAYPGETTINTGDITIPANTPDRSAHIVAFTADIAGAGLKIGAQIVYRFRRVALGGAGANPAADPFALVVGFHVEQDTAGSRTITAK